MVTIAALIDAPGLGQVVLQALSHLDVGTAFNARSRDRHHGHRPRPGHHRRQRPQRAGASPPAAAPAAARGRRWPSARSSPRSASTCRTPSCGRRSSPRSVDRRYADPALTTSDSVDWVQLHLAVDHQRASRTPSPSTLFNPLAERCSRTRRGGWPPWPSSSWPVIFGGRRARPSRPPSAWALIIATGLWQDAMTTLAATLVATVAGDGARRRPRGLDGPQRPGRPGDPADPGRRPGHAGVRLPGAVPGAVRAPAGSPPSSPRSSTPHRSSIKIVADGDPGVSPDDGGGGHRRRVEHAGS